MKEYQVAFKGRLKWISEQDKGIYDAMNKGIRIATGDVVGILNSDDFYTDENVLQTVADNFVNHSVDAVYGDIHFVREGNLDKCVRYYSSRLFSPFWLRFGCISPIQRPHYIPSSYTYQFFEKSYSCIVFRVKDC